MSLLRLCRDASVCQFTFSEPAAELHSCIMHKLHTELCGSAAVRTTLCSTSVSRLCRSLYNNESTAAATRTKSLSRFTQIRAAPKLWVLQTKECQC